MRLIYCYKLVLHLHYSFRLAAKRCNDRGKRRVPREVRRVFSRQHTNKSITKRMATISIGRSRAMNQGQGGVSYREEKGLCRRFQQLSLHDAHKPGDVQALPHQPQTRSLESTPADFSEDRRNHCSRTDHRLLRMQQRALSCSAESRQCAALTSPAYT